MVDINEAKGPGRRSIKIHTPLFDLVRLNNIDFNKDGAAGKVESLFDAQARITSSSDSADAGF
jgi:hypothetical protein